MKTRPGEDVQVDFGLGAALRGHYDKMKRILHQVSEPEYMAPSPVFALRFIFKF
jgi:hypothetical protein